MYYIYREIVIREIKMLFLKSEHISDRSDLFGPKN